MERGGISFRISVFVLVLMLVATVTQAKKAAEFVENQVIVKTKAGAGPRTVSAMQTDLNAKVARKFKMIRAEVWNISGMTVQEAIDQYRGHPMIEYIHPNYIVRIADVMLIDERFNEQWSLHNTGQTGGTSGADIDAPEAWQHQTDCEEVIIGVLDTGVDYNHPDLAGRIWINTAEDINGNGVFDNFPASEGGDLDGLDSNDDVNDLVDDVIGYDFCNYPEQTHQPDCDPMDEYGHGTHVAGIIGAAANSDGVCGVCWTSKMIVLKWMNDKGTGTTASIISSIEYALEMGVKITNNSYSMPADGEDVEGLRDAIETASEAGMLFVCSAGNSQVDLDTEPWYPAAYDLGNIISVAATDHSDQLAEDIESVHGGTWGSNWGSNSVDLAAPGVRILNTFTDPAYEFKSGTSMSAPHVAGVAALVWSAYPDLDYETVISVILHNVDELSQLTGITVTGGRLNANNALQSDVVPPAAAVDLAGANPTSNSIDLSWTATGDDGATGSAYSYDLRYALWPIDEANFDVAVQVNGTPHPASAGTAEAMTADGLDPGVVYYFAMKAADEWGNWSGISNCPSGTTLGAPVIALNTESLSDTLHAGETSTLYFTIQNVAQGNLDFDISDDAAWLDEDPLSGRIWANDDQEVEVTLDATSLYAGDYHAAIAIASNDPATPLDTVTVDLNVWGEPDIAVSDGLLDFGVVIVGNTETNSLRIYNEGTEVLNVLQITLNNADFTMDTTPFNVNPGSSRQRYVQFAPSAAGPITGTMTIESDDLDQPIVTVQLQGEGLDAPILSVTPASMDEILFSGGEETRTLTIRNDGLSDLVWSIRGAASPATGPMNVDMNGVKILFDRSIGQPELDDWSTLISALTVRGATVSENQPTSSITRSVLDQYDVFWSEDAGVGEDDDDDDPFIDPVSSRSQPLGKVGGEQQYWNVSEEIAISEWINDGGAMFLEADNSIAIFNNLLNHVGAGFTYSTTDGMSGATIQIYPHETTFGVISILLEGPEASLSGSITVPGAVLVKGNAGCWNTAYSMPGLGRMVTAADQLFINSALEQIMHGNRDFAVQVFEWLAAGWYSADPVSGILSPGQSVDVVVTIDAARLLGGEYGVVLVVESNDPSTPEVSVPVDVCVIDQPDCVVSAQIIRGGVPYTIPETFLFGCPQGDRGDILEITCDFDAADMGCIEIIDPEEIALDTSDLSFSFCDPVGSGTPGTAANGYVVTLTRVHIKGCSDCQGAGCDQEKVGLSDMSVYYYGHEIGVVEGLRVKSIDVTGDGEVNITENTEFGLTYNKQPGHPAFNGCYDFNGDGYVNLSDFSFFGQHYDHKCDAGGGAAPVAEGEASDPSVRLLVKRSRRTDSQDKLLVTVYLENVDRASSVCVGLKSDVPFLEYKRWIPNPDFTGVSVATQVVRGGENQLVLAGFGMENAGSGSIEIGTAEYALPNAEASSGDVSEPTVGEGDFGLAFGDVLAVDGSVMRISKVECEEELIVCRNFLGDCYPNPFNPTTTISYSIKERGHVALNVYNVAGQLVRTLVNDVQVPSTVRHVVWNGRNSSGDAVSSGVYFYRLVTKDFTQTKKMVLLK